MRISSLLTMRRFHTSLIGQAIKPVFKPHDLKKGLKKFNDSFNTGSNCRPEQKIWDKLNISKHEYFIRKYAHISPEKRKALDDKVTRQRSLREQRRKHEMGDDYDLPRKPRPALNPLAEYLFGTHSVLSALTAGKREAFSTLYIQKSKDNVREIVRAARKFGVRVVEKSSKGEMNTLSSNGVHNGVVLETKPLLIPEIHDLDLKFDGTDGLYSVTVYDEETDVPVQKACHVARTTAANANKHPLGVFVDGITDPQNLGSIVRSAYFLGADFLVIPSSESARLGPVAAKASAGALDLLPIYKADRSLHFVESAKRNGWCIVTTSSRQSQDDLAALREKHRVHVSNKYIEASDLAGLLHASPMLMILGSEGSGVRANMKLRSDFLVGLDKRRLGEDLVDSLNVGVAAGLLISKCFE